MEAVVHLQIFSEVKLQFLSKEFGTFKQGKDG